MKKLWQKILTITTMAVLVITGMPLSASAVGGAEVNQTILEKALYKDLYNCYTGGYIKPFMQIENFKDAKSLVIDDAKKSSGSYTVKLPNGYTSESDASIRCDTLLGGKIGFDGIIARAGKTVPSKNDKAAVGEFLENMGYTRNANGTKTCTKGTMTRSTTYTTVGVISLGSPPSTETTVYTPTVCAQVDDNGNLTSVALTVDKSGQFVDTSLVDIKAKKNGEITITGEDGPITYKEGDSWAKVRDDIFRKVWSKANLGAGSEKIVGNTIQSTTYNSGGDYNNFISTETIGANYEIMATNRYNAALKAISWLSDGKYVTTDANGKKKLATSFSEQEKVVLYQTYLEDFYGATEAGGNLVCNPSDSLKSDLIKDKYSAANKTGWIKMSKWYGSDGKVNTNCFIRAGAANIDKKVNGLSNNVWWKQMTFKEVADALGATTVSELSSEYAEALGTTLTTDDAEAAAEEAEDDKCFGVTGALGWFVCPIIEAASNILETAYDDLIKPIVSVSPGIVDALSTSGSNDGGNGIYMAWGLFRNIANIAFIIMFLVVIFSQLTGIGIDNYGIKRTLPRLIVTAVLVNFSFLICQLAVDISNILGQGLEDMLVNLGNQITGADAVLNAMAEGSSGAHSAGWKTVGGLLGGLAMSAGAGFGAFMVSGTAFWGPLLLALGSAVIAIVFGFILLGVRQAIIVILVVTSPIAFILYALPNTNNLFKRWGKMFIDLLLVFPAAGLLIGGGFFTSRLLISVGGDSIIFQLIAMLLLCVPYFLIIPLVRSSLSAFGNIGAQIQNLGRNVSKGATGAIRNSDAYKNWQTRSRTAGIEPKTGKDGKPKRFSGLRGAFATTSLGQAMGYNRLVADQIGSADELERKDRRANALLNSRIEGGTRLESEYAADVEAALNGDGDVDTALETFMLNSGDKSVADWYSNYLSGLDANNKDDRTKIEALSKYMRKNDKLDQKLRSRDKTAYEYALAGGKVSGNARDGYTYGNIHNAAFGARQTAIDRAHQNSNALRRDALDGKFTQDVAMKMLTTTNPEISGDITTDSGKRPVIEAAAQGRVATTLNGETIKVDALQESLGAQRKGVQKLSVNGGATHITDNAGNDIEGYMPGRGFTMDGNTQAVRVNGDVLLMDSKGAVWNATQGTFADATTFMSANAKPLNTN